MTDQVIDLATARKTRKRRAPSAAVDLDGGGIAAHPAPPSSGSTVAEGAPAVVLSPRDRWLQERRKGVGASELAAILGEDPRRGPLAVYADKVAGRPSEDEEAWLTFGRDVEGAILRGYSRKTGRELINRDGFEVIRHPDQKLLSATPDAFTQGSEKFPAPAEGRGALDGKAVGFHKRDEWASEAPLYFVIQVQAQMGCARLAWGSLAALMGGIYIADPVDLVRDDNFLAIALDEVERFWWHVTHRVPPDADAKAETRDALRRLFTPNNELAIALDQPGDLALVEGWERAKAEASSAEEAKDLAVNRLHARMGEAAVGYLPDGSSFLFKGEQVKASLCACGREKKAAFVRRVPRRWWPKHLKPGWNGKEE